MRCFWRSCEWRAWAGSRKFVKSGVMRRTASMELTNTMVRPGYLRRK